MSTIHGTAGPGPATAKARASRAYGYVFQAPALYILAGRGARTVWHGRQLTHSRLPNGFRSASSAALAA